MIAAAADAKKKYDTADARVLAATTLLKEEQCAAAVLTREAHAAAALIEPPSPTLPLDLTSRAASSDDDYEAAIITNIHVQVIGVKNICSLISVTLDLSSAHYARWCDNVLLTLGRYSLSDHVLLDPTSVGVPAWDQIDIVVKSCIWGTISPDL
jgi:hypothetical protein